MALNLEMTSLLAILCLGFCCVVNGKSLFDSPFGNDLDNLDIDKGFDALVHQFDETPDSFTDCKCSDSGCVCCKVIDIPEIKFHKWSCFSIGYRSRSRSILTGIQLGNVTELIMYTGPGNLPFTGGCLSPRVNNGVVGFQIDIKSNSTSGFTACAYLAIYKPPLIPMCCFTLGYGSNKQSNDNVQDVRQDFEAVENDIEAVYQKNELYIQMKRSLFMNKEN